MKTYLERVLLTDRHKSKIEKQLDKKLRNLRKTPNDERLHIEIGDAYCLLEEYDEAETYYMKAITLLRRGTVEEDDRKQIIMLYGKILSFAPDSDDMYLQLGEEYAAAGQKEKATRFLLSSAKKAFENGNYQLALDCYNKVIEMGKSNPYIIERSTELYLKLGRKPEAITNYMHIGDIYSQEEKHVEALGYYKKAHALDPQDPEMIRKVATIYDTMGWTENAAAEFVKMAAVYEHNRHFAEALKYYQHALDLDAENEKAQIGKDRVEEAQVIETPWQQTDEEQVFVNDDVLQELDQVENALQKTTSFALASDSSDMDTPIIDLTARLAHRASMKAASEPKTDMPEPEETVNPHQTADDTVPEGHDEQTEIIEEDSLLAKDFFDGLFIEETELLEASPQDEQETSDEVDIEIAYEDDESFEPFPVSEPDLSVSDYGRAVTAIEPISEDLLNTLNEAGEEGDEELQPHSESVQHTPDHAQESEAVHLNNTPRMGQLLEKVEELEKQLEHTQEEKSVLQEQFTAQIVQLKSREQTVIGELETISQDKRELQQRLDRIAASNQSRHTAQDTQVDHTRYDAIVEKIQQKKHLLQEHLTTLLQQREENRLSLTEDLKHLGSTKQRLQQNLEYIQKVKTQIEQKINTELQQARAEILALTKHSEDLKHQIAEQQQLEQELREQFDLLQREKVMIEEQSTETISALTGENETLERQLRQLRTAKSREEDSLKKKMQALHQSYRRLKNGYTTSLQAKEQELGDTAQRLNEFADKYVKLERTLSGIRTERDKLDEMLAHETATREMLEGKLGDIEEQVDSLEIHGTELLKQFGQELDRQFNLDQSISNEFQSSLDEVEHLLARQEQEIRSLEAI